MKKIIIMLFAVSLFHNFAFSQWVPQTSGTTQTLQALEVINANTIYAVGNSAIFLKTINGGTNWVSVSVPAAGDLLCMQFFDASTGYVAGESGSAFKTTNAGVNWVNVSVNPPTTTALTIFFTNTLTGYMGNVNGGLRKTTNGGVNWSAITSGTSLDINNIFFFDSNTGWFGSGAITSTSGCLIRKTTNAGANWTTQLTHNSIINSFCFIDASTGYAASFAQIFKTSNGGVNWIGLNPGPFGNIRSIVAGSTSSILFSSGANGKILKSTNSGANWAELTSGSTNLLREIELNPGSNLIGWTVGNGGTILKTTNGGGGFVGITPVSGEVPENFSLSQNYPNPFNPETKINFSIPAAGQLHAIDVRLTVYDMLGKEIAVLVNENLAPGSYSVNFNASSLPSGTYFYRLTAGSFTQTKKLTLIK